MTRFFSELGSIMYSKACKYSGLYPITKDDILMYYNVLNTENITFPPKLSVNNHISCCLFYLAKDNKDYREKFIEKYLKTINGNIKVNEENLVLMFNIIEFDKSYLKSKPENIAFLYQILKNFSNYPTNFEHYMLYKYFRGYTKFRIGDIQNANREHLEIVAELPEKWKSNFFLKYIKLRNDLLKISLVNTSKLKDKSEFTEYVQILKDLYEEVKLTNKSLALKFGFDLFSSYLEAKNYNNCIPLLLEMKKILKKDLLKGTTMKNGIDYYLAISSRLGYIGVIVDNKKIVNSAIKKIKKTLEIIKKDTNNEKLVNITKTYSFILAILEISLTKQTKFDLKSLASEFRQSFLPGLEKSNSSEYYINEQNEDNIIIDFQIISNNMNKEISDKAKTILKNCQNEINKGNNSNNIFLTFISAMHNKINNYSLSYISDKNETKRKDYKKKIVDCFELFIIVIYKLYENELLLNTKYVKTMILEMFSAHAHVYLYEKDFSQLRRIINSVDDITSKLQIEKDLPAYGLICKIKGDYWFYNKDYKASITYYENALELFEKNEPKIAPVLFNIGCIYFFQGNKPKAITYLNRCINEYNNVLMQKNIFGFTPDVERINKNIDYAKMLLNQLTI
jgi:tetratricopeptide (TPR) repeat protein